MDDVADLSRVLETIFSGEWVVTRVNFDVYAVKKPGYEIWVTKTVVRNHSEILKRMRDTPVNPGYVREWTRSTYIVASDFCLPQLENFVLLECKI